MGSLLLPLDVIELIVAMLPDNQLYELWWSTPRLWRRKDLYERRILPLLMVRRWHTLLRFMHERRGRPIWIAHPESGWTTCVRMRPEPPRQYIFNISLQDALNTDMHVDLHHTPVDMFLVRYKKHSVDETRSFHFVAGIRKIVYVSRSDRIELHGWIDKWRS